MKSIIYDVLPPCGLGAIWGNCPHPTEYNPLFPSGTTQRNLKGRVSAVAYRSRGDEPFYYDLYSYDRRGRLEALVRYTENLGYEAIHYEYTKGDQLSKVLFMDGQRSFGTWYDYDENGRLWKVYSKLSPVVAKPNGSGLVSGHNDPVLTWRRPLTLNMITKPATADVVYEYDAAGRLTGKHYNVSGNPPHTTSTGYTYDVMDRL